MDPDQAKVSGGDGIRDIGPEEMRRIRKYILHGDHRPVVMKRRRDYEIDDEVDEIFRGL